MMILSYLIGQRFYTVPYDIKRILGYLILAIVLSGISLNTNTNYFINTFLVLLFLGSVVLLENNELKKLLKR
jgi:VanZ family protein